LAHIGSHATLIGAVVQSAQDSVHPDILAKPETIGAAVLEGRLHSWLEYVQQHGYWGWPVNVCAYDVFRFTVLQSECTTQTSCHQRVAAGEMISFVVSLQTKVPDDVLVIVVLSDRFLNLEDQRVVRVSRVCDPFLPTRYCFDETRMPLQAFPIQGKVFVRIQSDLTAFR
jgi:hypothetical protein